MFNTSHERNTKEVSLSYIYIKYINQSITMSSPLELIREKHKLIGNAAGAGTFLALSAQLRNARRMHICLDFF